MAIETRRSTCNRDCPDACGLVADVEDNEIVRLRGDADHPVTRGFLCSRTSNFPAVHTGPDRLRSALVRGASGALEPASLDEALDRIAARLLQIRSESGPAAIFHYRSGGSLGLLKQVADRFFEEFGPCTVKSGDICSGAGESAQIVDFGASDSNDLFDLLESRHIVIWGKNPLVSNLHLVPVLNDAKARGAKVTLIDPVHHRGTSLADHYLQPRPGGDLDLALGVARVLRDRDSWIGADLVDGLDAFAALVDEKSLDERAAAAGLSIAEIEGLAEALRDGPTAILVGWGMQRRLHGGAIVRALDALCVLSGNLGRSGGGCSFYFQRRQAFASIHSGAAARHVREPMFGADLLAAKDPVIRALWVTAGNPVAMLPDSATVARAIEQTEFVVVVDPFLTDTARRADVVLPVPTLFEDDDLLGAYGHHWIAESRPLVDPPAGVVAEVEVFRRLAERVGMGSDSPFAASAEEWKRRLMRDLEVEDGITLETLRADQGRAVRPPRIPSVPFQGGRVATPSGKVPLPTAADLHGADLARSDESSEYPLWLFSNSVRDGQSSQWSRAIGDLLPVTVHPAVARAAGCGNGDRAILRSPIAALDVRVRTDSAQRSDVAIVPKGGHFDQGQSANALISARPTDIGLGAAFLDCHVRLESVDGEESGGGDA